MKTRLHKFLLLILAIALASAPLRSGWAMQDTPATSTESHCEQLALEHADSGNSDSQECATDCGGSCCEASCSSCIPAASAISATLKLLPFISTGTHHHLVRIEFSGRTVIPPLRPPTTL